MGFDIVDQKTEEQLQCLASSTGGRYLSAASAGELSLALLEQAGDYEIRYVLDGKRVIARKSITVKE